MNATHKIYAPLYGVIFLVLVVATLSFWSFRQTSLSAEAHEHTYSVIGRADALLYQLTDAETSERGYLLTGDEAFLEPYLATRDSISHHMEELGPLTLISAAKERLNALGPLVAAKMVDMAQVIELRRSSGMTAALAAVDSGQGKRLMDSIRAEMRAFIQIEDEALAQRDAAHQSNTRNLFAIIVTASALMLVLVLAFAYLLYRETQHRLGKLVHLDTQRSLEIQKRMNQRMQQANATLQISEEKLAVTLTSIGDAVITTDAEGRVTLFNPLAEQLTGWTLAEATGRPVEEIFHIINQETRQPSVVPIKETLAHGTLHGLANHTVLIARDGSECAIADSCAPIRDRDRQVIGAVLVFRDVTKEDKARLALRDSAALIQTILNTVADGIITIHATGGIIEKVNPVAERMFGYAVAELIGQNFSLLIPELDRDQRNGSLEYYSASDEARAAGLGREVMGRRKDGSTFPLEMAASEMSLGGKRYFTGIVRDITARKQIKAERALLDQALREKNVELESAKSVADKANLAKSDFLSSMSHELRSPLNAILGFAQLMDSGSPRPTTSQKRGIDQILKAGWYLLELINEILDLALIESGKLSLSLEPISLSEVMGECQAMIEPQAQKRGISVAFPGIEIPWFVEADHTRLKQILINLLSNAIKYNKIGGSVLVDCTAITPQRVRVSVKDTGAGLAPEQLAQLFQPFNRLGQEANVEEGTGIGLVVCKRLVELIGGAIGVESTVGQGSVFWLELNLTAKPQPAAGAAEPAVVQMQVQADAQLHTLLYIEDNPANLMLVEDLITRRPDIRLLNARDGIRGVEMAHASRPDVILMDINLPGISGVEALRILAKDLATAQIPVIALSANAMRRDIEKGLAAGFFRYLTKPIKVNEFMETLDAALTFAKTRAARAEKKLIA